MSLSVFAMMVAEKGAKDEGSRTCGGVMVLVSFICILMCKKYNQ